MGLLRRLPVNWPHPADRPCRVNFVQVFMIRDGLIADVRRYNDPASAAQVISLG